MSSLAMVRDRFLWLPSGAVIRGVARTFPDAHPWKKQPPKLGDLVNAATSRMWRWSVLVWVNLLLVGLGIPLLVKGAGRG